MGFVAANNSNGSFGDFEMFGEQFNESGVCLTVVGLGTEIDSELVGGGDDDFFLGTAGLDGD